MAAPGNRPPHLGVLAAGRELAAYAEVTPECARQITLRDWWTIPPLDFIGGRFVYSYPAAVTLLNYWGYPRRLHPDPRRPPRTKGGRIPRATPPRVHMGVLAGVGEIARFANVPTSRAAVMPAAPWWDVPALDHLAGGSVYSYPAVVECLTARSYPHRPRGTIGERMEASAVAQDQ